MLVNNKKLINLQTFSVLILIIIFLIGVVFFTDLLPPINKEKETKPTNTTEIMGETKGLVIENEAAKAEQNNQAGNKVDGTTPSTGGSYVPPICEKTSIPYQKVYDKVSWLNSDQTEIKKKGREGYKQVCSPDSNGYKPDDIIVPPVNEEVFMGNKDKSSNSGLDRAIDRILGRNN